jgi:hypothetical protein
MGATSLPALRLTELDAEAAALLPRRETLCQFGCVNLANVVGVNLAIAVNAATINSSAHALALQYLHSSQYQQH